jgi:hypothetical protein
VLIAVDQRVTTDPISITYFDHLFRSLNQRIQSDSEPSGKQASMKAACERISLSSSLQQAYKPGQQ